MLKFSLIHEDDNKIIYKYCPEGVSESGIISFDRFAGTCDIEILAKNDHHRWYALKLFHRIRKMAKKNAFEKEGMIAWY